MEAASPPRQQRQPLPQDYGFKPGTSMIGCFGTTERRFDGSFSRAAQPGTDGPGPAAYNVRRSPRRSYGEEWRKGFGTEARALDKPILASPGPGAYSSGLSSAERLERGWPNRKDVAVFGSNHPRWTVKPENFNPGPGSYEPSSEATIKSPSKLGACWPKNARNRKGNLDLSKSVGRRLNWKGEDETVTVTPGPMHYALPLPSEMGPMRLRREQALRRPEVNMRIGFSSSVRRVVDSGAKRDAAETPGPLSYNPVSPSLCSFTPSSSPERISHMQPAFLSTCARDINLTNRHTPLGCPETPGPGRYATHLADDRAVGGSRSPNKRIRNPAADERRGRLLYEQMQAESFDGRVQPARGKPSPGEVLAYLVSGEGSSVVGTSVHSQSLRGQLSGVVRVTM